MTSPRKASTTLRRVPVELPLPERDPAPAARDFGALAWQGSVRLAADRASGVTAARRQAHVRAGLFERALALGADHAAGPHRERPEAARRLLAHIDALAEAGTSPAALGALAGDAEIDRVGALWTITLLHGCLDAPDAEEAFLAFLDGLDPARFTSYRPVVEIAEALAIQPNPMLLAAARPWTSGLRAAIAIEATGPDEITADLAQRAYRTGDPLVIAAIERLFARAPSDVRPAGARASWMDIQVPALSFEVARARLLQRDLEPLFCVRVRDARAIAALGPHAMDVLAIAGDATDAALAAEVAGAHASSPMLLDAMGRAGYPSLFPRLLADLADDDLDDDAHAALAAALGPLVPRPRVPAWEAAIGTLGDHDGAPSRLRGGEPHAMSSVLAEMGRADLSAIDLLARADEVLVKTGRPSRVRWDVFGASLEGAVSELGRLAR